MNMWGGLKVENEAHAEAEQHLRASVTPERLPVVKVAKLGKRFHRRDGTEVTAINDVSFELYAGEIMVLLGPSGCGKTTLLRCIAGLERPDVGTIDVQGQTVFCSDRLVDVPAERRKLSMVFQSYALWPHMTVAENVAYPLRSLPRAKRPSKAEIARRVDQIMEVVGIGGLQRQHPNAISGGQQQRVALCRALIAGSSLVLFDEPLSNVDAQVREQLRVELLLMQRELQFAALFVTHDRQEAMVLANHMAILDKGRISQLGTPNDIYRSPSNSYVAGFIGPTNEVPVSSIASGEDPEMMLVAETTLGRIRGCLGAGVDSQDGLVAVWRPECTVVSTEEPAGENHWKCVIEHSLFYGSQTEHMAAVAGQSVRVLLDGEAVLPSGTPAWISVDPRHVSFLPK